MSTGIRHGLAAFVLAAAAIISIGALHAASELSGATAPALAADSAGDSMTKDCGARLESFIRGMREQFDALTPTSDAQRRALDAFKSASAKALDLVQTACANEKSAAAIKDLEAAQVQMQAALETLLPAIQNLYASLSDEQKAQIEAFGHDIQGLAQTLSELALNLDQYFRNDQDHADGPAPFHMCFADVCFSFKDGRPGERRRPHEHRREQPPDDREDI